MHLIWKAIRQEFYLKLVLGISLLVGGAIGGYVFFKKENIMAVFGLVAILLGLKLLRDAIRHSKVEEELLWQLLHRESGRWQIVWVYTMTTQVMPFGFLLWERGVMFFKLIDGKEISIELPANKQKMVSRFLNRLLTHASFGYSDERQHLFDRDPSMLIRNDGAGQEE